MVFEPNRNKGPDADPAPSSAPDTALQESLASPALSQARLEETWRQAEEKVSKIADGLGRGIDTQVKGVVAALQAHGFDTCYSCEGHMYKNSMPQPTIGLGDLGGYLPIRFEGQEQRFRERLAEIPLPLGLRLSHPLTVGFSSMTPEIFAAIDKGSFRQSYKEVHEAVIEAHRLSATDTVWKPGREHEYEHNFTSDEIARRTKNAEKLGQLQALVEEFNTGRNDPPETKLWVRGPAPSRYDMQTGGNGFDMFVGDIDDTELRDHTQRSQELLDRRQGVAKDFAEFLKAKYFGQA